MMLFGSVENCRPFWEWRIRHHGTFWMWELVFLGVLDERKLDIHYVCPEVDWLILSAGFNHEYSSLPLAGYRGVVKLTEAEWEGLCSRKFSGSTPSNTPAVLVTMDGLESGRNCSHSLRWSADESMMMRKHLHLGLGLGLMMGIHMKKKSWTCNLT